MKKTDSPSDRSKWILHQLRGLQQHAPGVLANRRDSADRRRRVWWSVIYGSLNPRRRAPRRSGGHQFQMIDWHDSHLLAVAICILILCVADAFMTLELLSRGAREANPIMSTFVYSNVKVFTIVKMMLTGVGVSVLVFLARYRFLRTVRVGTLLYFAVVIYAALISYEIWMFDDLSDMPLFP